jgi:hypothetical protein
MSFSSENGYVPVTVEAIMESIMDEVNTQFGTTYTVETFEGTNFYKFYYALVQRLQENEVKTSEIFTKLTQYFALTNESISRPVATSPGLIEALSEAGYVASIKPMVDADAGKLHVCVDVDETGDDYAAEKLEIATVIMNSSAAGVVSQGAEVETIVLTNGQSFDFKFDLPNRIEVLLRLTTTLSENNQVVVESPEDQKAALLANIAEHYALGKNFEPQRYFSTEDAPWASNVLLEWSDDNGSTWFDTVYDAEYDDLFTILLENISLVET